MTFAEAIRSVLDKYADFSGRARRSEYWFWSLALFLVYIVAVIIFVVSHVLGAILYVLLILAAIVPSLAVSVRRLHDTGKSGWWLLIGLIPLGGIVILVFTVMDSDPAPNQYGPSPKAGGMDPGAAYGGQPGYGTPPA